MQQYLKILWILLFVNVNESTRGLEKIFEWGPEEVDYVWPKPSLRKYYLYTGQYIPKNNVVLGIAVHPFKPIMFTTVPRWKRGVISTLNWVPLGTGKLNEPLRPYPNWEVNNIYVKEGPYKIISVIRMAVDCCNRLWIVDSGYDNKVIKRIQLAPAKIVIFNLNTDQVERIHVIEENLQYSNSSFGKIVVDVTPESCDNAFAYISDVTSPGLLVYDYCKDYSFRVYHPYLAREAQNRYYTVGSQRVISPNNIDGICLSPVRKEGFRILYMNPHDSNKLYITTTSYLHNENLKDDNDLFFSLGSKCSSGCETGGAQVVDEQTGVMFYGTLSRSSINCWRGDVFHLEPSTQEIPLVVSPELDYISDMTISRNRYFFTISCQLRKFFAKNEGVTSRIFIAKVDRLIHGTNCKPT